MPTLRSNLHTIDLRTTDAECRGELLSVIPNPQQVRATAAEIRRSWTPRERRRRAQLARSMFIEALLVTLALPAPLRSRYRPGS